MMEIRRANLEDIQVIKDISTEFWEESNFAGLEPDVENWETLITNFIIHPESTATFVAINNKKEVVGYLAMLKEKYYTKYPLANMFLFYVKPDSRRSSAGINLLRASIEQAKSWKACAYYVGISAGITQTEGTLLNLYRKMGFKDAGTFQRMVF